MKQRTNQTLYGYWNEVRRGRIAPRRFDIEPSRISLILPETFILEHAHGDRFLFRLAGTRICELFGREFRGSNLLDLFIGEHRALVERLLAVGSIEGAVSTLSLTCHNAGGRQIRLEMLLLPLLHTDDRISRFLGGMGELGAADWLGYEPIVAVDVAANELIWPDGRPHSVLSRLHRPGTFAAPGRSTEAALAARRQFRVLDGGLGAGPRERDPEPAGAGSGRAVPKTDGV